jgi:DNA-binding NtrC family response regulator
MEAFKVLLVDDETDFLDTLTKRLRKRGLDVNGVGTGEDALVYLENAPVDVVVLDVKMPGMGGTQTLLEIKRRYPLVEVIMLTGHADMQSAIHGLEMGAFDYLMKPMDIDDIMYKLQDANKRKMLKEQTQREKEGKNGS